MPSLPFRVSIPKGSACPSGEEAQVVIEEVVIQEVRDRQPALFQNLKVFGELLEEDPNHFGEKRIRPEKLLAVFEGCRDDEKDLMRCYVLSASEVFTKEGVSIPCYPGRHFCVYTNSRGAVTFWRHETLLDPGERFEDLVEKHKRYRRLLWVNPSLTL